MHIIAQIIAAKTGNKEFLLTGEDEEWIAAIGNTSNYVAIGEGITYGDDGAEFIACAETPEAALEALLAKVIAG